MQIIYGNAIQSVYTIFQKPNSFIRWECLILTFHDVFAFQNCFFGVRKQKGKLVFRRIDIIHVWLIAYCIANQLNLLDFNNLGCY